MFIQNFQNGKIFKNLSTMQYVLKIDGKEYYADSIREALEEYSEDQHRKVSKKVKG